MKEKRPQTFSQSSYNSISQASKLKSLEMVYDSPIWTGPVEPWTVFREVES